MSEDPAAVLHRLLLARGQTVAVAESLTGGLLSAALTGTPGASATFRGGLVVYATELKAILAGVDAGLLQRTGPVDPEVARQLADGVRSRLGADWGIGITGVAGPDRQNGVPVGTVYVGLAGPDGVTHAERLSLDGDRNTIRTASVTQAVRLLVDRIDKD